MGVLDFFSAIWNWLMGLFSGMASWLSDLIPPPPPEVLNLGTVLADVAAYLRPMCNWVNGNQMEAALSAAFAAWVLGFTIKLGRVVISHIPQIGGGGN